ncbi:tapasin-like isoform X2 [Pelobates cultripes]|uniref:Tapasin-like isoform X2 n=1 Tax=Pelobates cultripes TaxID=61616 RepID=A0AAD1SP49_PELCU|nr:tapasin-like isoform X2 [Pelobates cultripes]
MKFFIWLWIFLPFSDLMEVKTNTPETTSMLGKDVLLDCHFINAGSVKLEDIAVKWTVDRRSQVKTIYLFDGKTEQYHKDRITLDLMLIKEGNASIHLQDVTLEDEGDYKCTILITPDVGSSTVLLKVAAQPSVALAPVNPHLSHGETKTFFCEASQFYPQDIEIIWLLKSHGEEVPLTTKICTGLPSLIDNGTFNVSSQISMIFTEEDAGSVYICEVNHESLPRPLRRNTTILFAIPEMIPRDTGFIVGVVSVILITLVVFLGVGIMYQKQFAKAPPLSDVILPDFVPANEAMNVICNINGFRPPHQHSVVPSKPKS